MPQAVATWLTSTAFAGVSYATLIQTALVVYGAYSSMEAKRQMAAAMNRPTDYSDHTVTYRSSDAPRTLVYGRTRVGGLFTYGCVHGDHDEYLSLVFTVAGTEIDGIEDILFDDTSIGALDAAGRVQFGSKWWKAEDQARIWESGSGAHTQGSYLTIPSNALSIISLVERVAGDENSYTLRADLDYLYLGSGSIQLLRPTPASTSDIQVTYRCDVGRPLVRVKKFLGSESGERDNGADGYDAGLESFSGGQWTAAHLGKNVARVRITLEFHPDVFGANGAPQVSVILRGRKCYSYSTGTTAWTENAILHAADYIRHPYGMSADSSEVEATYAEAAEAICAESIDTGRPAPLNTQMRYRAGGVLTTDEEPRINLEKLLAASLGAATWSVGQWVLRAGVAETPTTSLHDKDLAPGEVVFGTAIPRKDLFNSVRGTFTDAENFYKPNSFPAYSAPAFVTADNNETIYANLDLPMVQDSLQAQRIAKAFVLRARQALTIEANFQLSAYWYQPGDMVYLCLEAYGWNTQNGGLGKAFRVKERKISVMGELRMLLQEESAAWSDWLSNEGSIPDAAPNTDFPDPGYVKELTGVQFFSGEDYVRKNYDGTVTARVEATWDAITDSAVLSGGRIEWFWKPSEAKTWQAAPVNDPQNVRRVEFGPVRAGQSIDVIASVYNSAGGRSKLFSASYVTSSTIPSTAVTYANLVVNAGFRYGTQGWVTWKEDTANPGKYAVLFAGIVGNPRSVMLYQTGTAQYHFGFQSEDDISVEPGKRYAVGTKIIPDRCTGWTGITLLDSARNVIAYIDGDHIGPQSGYDDSNEAAYIRSKAFIDMPSNARYMRIHFIKGPTSSGSDSGMLCFKPQVSQVLDGQTTFPLWDAGVQGIISTPQIALGATYEIQQTKNSTNNALSGRTFPFNAGVIGGQLAQTPMVGPYEVDTTVILTAQAEFAYTAFNPLTLGTYYPRLNLGVIRTTHPSIPGSVVAQTMDNAPPIARYDNTQVYNAIARETIDLPAGQYLYATSSTSGFGRYDVPDKSTFIVNSASISVEVSKRR